MFLCHLLNFWCTQMAGTSSAMVVSSVFNESAPEQESFGLLSLGFGGGYLGLGYAV